MDIVIGILELVGLVLVVIYLFTHHHKTNKAGGCGCSGTAPTTGGVDLSFSSPTGGCS